MLPCYMNHDTKTPTPRTIISPNLEILKPGRRPFILHAHIPRDRRPLAQVSTEPNSPDGRFRKAQVNAGVRAYLEAWLLLLSYYGKMGTATY